MYRRIKLAVFYIRFVLEFMGKVSKKTLLFAVIVVAIMVVIYLLSSQNASISSGTSGRVTRLICRIIFFDFGNLDASEQQFLVSRLNPFVRKLAHFTLYMLLGMATYSATLTLDTVRLKHRWPIALAICVVYAVMDEIHQLFIPERAGMITDVLLDSAGAVAGILIVRVIVLVISYIRTFISGKKQKQRKV